jgi:hypothetical protein
MKKGKTFFSCLKSWTNLSGELWRLLLEVYVKGYMKADF